MAPCCAVAETEEILGVAEQGTALTVSFPKLPVRAVLIAVPCCCHDGIHGHFYAVRVKLL